MLNLIVALAAGLATYFLSKYLMQKVVIDD